MNSNRHSLIKIHDAENSFSNNISLQLSKDPEIFPDTNTLDFRFLKNKSKFSNKLNTEKNSKKNVFMSSIQDNKKIKSILSAKITKKEIFNNNPSVKYYTANIKNLNKRLNPSFEKYKTKVKQAFTGKICIICREQ